MRVYNFSAGPSMLPLEVLQTAQSSLLNYDNSGMSITEMSHRSKNFMAVNDEAQALLRELLSIPDEYFTLFVQGGASQQFSAIPLNLLKNGKADYVVTGNFAKKAYQEGLRYGDMAVAASSEDRSFTYIPDMDATAFREGIDYVHFTHNNTIFGTRFTKLPKTSAPLVCDMSSSILSQETDVSDYGLIYAGAQKNMGPSGLTVVILLQKRSNPAGPLDHERPLYDAGQSHGRSVRQRSRRTRIGIPQGAPSHRRNARLHL